MAEQRRHAAHTHQHRVRRRRGVVVLVLLGFAVVVVLFAFVYPTRTFLSQRKEVSAAERRLQVLEEGSEALRRDNAQLETDAEVERRAREEADPWIPRGDRPHDLRGPVRGAVIEDEDLRHIAGERAQARERGTDRGRLVARGDEDRDRPAGRDVRRDAEAREGDEVEEGRGEDDEERAGREERQREADDEDGAHGRGSPSVPPRVRRRGPPPIRSR